MQPPPLPELVSPFIGHQCSLLHFPKMASPSPFLSPSTLHPPSPDMPTYHAASISPPPPPPACPNLSCLVHTQPLPADLYTSLSRSLNSLFCSPQQPTSLLLYDSSSISPTSTLAFPSFLVTMKPPGSYPSPSLQTPRPGLQTPPTSLQTPHPASSPPLCAGFSPSLW
jgi:hypothetical protein